jgi:hypothetical protein
MKTVKQLLRQPLKTLMGVLMVTLAVAILCVCVGQAIAVRTTTQKLNQQFSTVAIPEGKEITNGFQSLTSPVLEQEFIAWLEKTAAENPEIVKQIYRHGILSAYIPGLSPLNIMSEKYKAVETKDYAGFYTYEALPYDMPYSCAMLVITLKSASEPEVHTESYPIEERDRSEFSSEGDYYQWLAQTEKETVTKGYTVTITGVVTDVLSLQEGYIHPAGRTARLTMTVPTLADIEKLNLIPGEQYVVYGMDYSDEYWKLVGELCVDEKYDFIEFEPFDPYRFKEVDSNHPFYKDIYGYLYGIRLKEHHIPMVNTVTMTLGVPVPLTEYAAIRDGKKLVEMRPLSEIIYLDKNGETVQVSIEEYASLYTIPTITPLNGSVEDFFASADAIWQGAARRDEINNHAFAIIGVDKLGYVADYAFEKERVVRGRDFTAEELENGAKVCIIHEELAEKNGLQLGDTFTVNLYETDFGMPYQSFRREGNVLNPGASFWFETTPFAETAEYTIVGICRGEYTFPDVADNEYAFSGNTIYVPKTSVQTEMESCDAITFLSVGLENGQIDAFFGLAREAGYAGRFQYCDGDYTEIANNFHNYEALARQVLTAGVVIYVILVVLFMLLYPVSQKQTVRIMWSLGTKGIRRYLHVLLSGIAIVLPGTLLGCLLGILSWDGVVRLLQISADSAMALQMEPGVLLLIAGAQLMFAAIVNALVPFFVIFPKGMAKRR